MGRTELTIVQRSEGAIKQHLSALKALTSEADQLKRVVKESKTAA